MRKTICVALLLFAASLLGQEIEHERDPFGLLVSPVYPTSLVAQEIEYERVLLPVIAPNPMPGAFGSLWTTHLAVVNEADRPVSIIGFSVCNFECFDVEIRPGVTFYPRVFANPADGGRLIWIEREFADRVRLLLRAQDLSRQGESYGTRIPVVRESEFFVEPVSLIDIPTSRDFRVLLRVYGLEQLDSEVTVRFYRTTESNRTPWDPNDYFLFETKVPLDSRFRWHGYGELNISNIHELAGIERLRVEIEPTTPGMKYWAFATVTNNETQHVTLITAD